MAKRTKNKFNKIKLKLLLAITFFRRICSPKIDFRTCINKAINFLIPSLTFFDPKTSCKNFILYHATPSDSHSGRGRAAMAP